MHTDAGIKHATAHHQKVVIAQKRREVAVNSQISAYNHDAVNSVEANDVEKVNNGNNNVNANDKPSAHNHEQIDGTDVANTENVSDVHDKEADNM
jgi:hypothetical protein